MPLRSPDSDQIISVRSASVEHEDAICVLFDRGSWPIYARQSAGRHHCFFLIANNAPANGLWIMRPWVGISDSSFTTYTIGQGASAAVQHEAEDEVTGDRSNTLPPSQRRAAI
jgi:hypothetical protein